jgi:alanyl-tRNA synthetase
MPNKSIEKLQQEQRKLEARLRRVQSQAKSEKRKLDTKRKILTGAAVLAEAIDNDEFRELLLQILDKRITRNSDRVVLELDVNQDNESTKADVE